MTALTEAKDLRNWYGRKAASALCRRFGSDLKSWYWVLGQCARNPDTTSAGLMLFAEKIIDPESWAAVTRYVWLCERVWRLEQESKFSFRET